MTTDGIIVQSLLAACRCVSLVAASVFLTLGLAACGGDDSPSSQAVSKDQAAVSDKSSKGQRVTRYRVTDLGTLGGPDSVATGINDAGQISGTSLTLSNEYHAVLWSGATVTDLGTLGGSGSFANGINSAGKIVGSSLTASGAQHAFIWDGRSMKDLGVRGTLNGNFSEASRINRSGEIVGKASFAGYANDADTIQAVRWQRERPERLERVALEYSDARGINDFGEVVGSSRTKVNTGNRATLWTGKRTVDLGTLGGIDSAANAVNQTGHIVGYSLTGDSAATHATLWKGRKAIDLGSLAGDYSVASDINRFDQIVGQSFIDASAYHATIWNDGTLTDLNSVIDEGGAGITLLYAYAINASGQIVGGMTINDQAVRHAFLLTPICRDRHRC